MAGFPKLTKREPRDVVFKITEPGHRRELARMCLTTTSSYDERRPTIKPQAKGD